METLKYIVENFNLQPLLITIAVIFFGYFLVRWVSKVMSSDEDAGKNFAAKIYKQRIFLLEAIVILMNGAEALVAASLGRDEGVNLATRASIHVSISAGGSIMGLSISAQWAEALQAISTSIEIDWTLLKTKEKIMAGFMVSKQVFDALFVTVGAIAAPIGNLYMIASGIGEEDILMNPALWGQMNYLLMGSTGVVIFHIFTVPFIGMASMDKIINMSMEDFKKLAQERLSKPKTLTWQNVVGYIQKNVGGNGTEADHYVNSDPTVRHIRKRELHDLVVKATEYSKIVQDYTSHDPQHVQQASDEMSKINQEIKTKLGI